MPESFDELKYNIPDEAFEIIQWLENNYVIGKIRRIMRGSNVIRTAPLFPPVFWSVFGRMELGIPRTQNRDEAWHRHFKTLVGKCNVGVYTIIEKIKKNKFK